VADGFEQIRFALLRPLVPRKKQKVRTQRQIAKISEGLHEKMTGQSIKNGKQKMKLSIASGAAKSSETSLRPINKPVS
jgi:hypothetical protein